MSESQLRLLVIGAHPDDAEYRAGGLAALYRRAGHSVRFVSVTNGDAGHHEIGGVELARRRREEATAAAAVCGLEYEIWDHHDGELQPSLDVRKQVIRLIRSYRPDLVLTHRPNDYHPDHRYTSQLVQDAMYLVTVPNICTDTPYLQRDPVAMYLADDFQRPWSFNPAVAVDIGGVIDEKLSMLHCHTSQMYEWLPHNWGRSRELPPDDADRLRWTAGWVEERGPKPQRFMELLERLYGARAAKIRWIEAFEPCEYGRPFDDQTLARLFWFLPYVEKLRI